MAGRMGLSVLHAAGLEGWACNSLEEYVRRAAATARAPEELARLRAGQRKRVLASPLGDTERFSANLIQAYRRMVGAG
jgi:predicted O-linked N-acetylglucosamine transferase (SPINDLY family)